MKKYLRLQNVLLLSLLTLLTVSCLDDDSNDLQRPQENIADLVRTIDDLSLLESALERADLVSGLEELGSFTLLAPNNAALSDFLESNDFANIDAVPVDILRQLLLNHVLRGEFRSGNLVGLSGYVETLAPGPITDTRLNMYADGTDGIGFNNMAKVAQGGRDITASNGSIHIVDAVIELPTLATFVLSDSNFRDLETALTAATPSVDYITLLGETALLTVFAPLDTAFDALLSGNLDWNSLDDIDEDLLNAVLSHHVIGGANIVSADIENNEESPATLEGDTLTFIVTANNTVLITDGSGNGDTAITAVDIQATNGVLHVINRVMIPNTEN
ncbi:fasciclin domain-containing protein [Ulvibacterium sp.]|uniref:fasciclin domain-containing protein n=1 Tax=Ulvibacterium sp. TaxID=2665914 RepID=UPI0026345C5D|nr:fasciclin domain-containing protein [Ulvibacterium sp.]